MPPVIFEIITILGTLLRFLGLAVFGLGFGYLALDLLRKTSLWQVQVAVFLGIAGLVIAFAAFSGYAALGALAAGIGVAVLLWGMPRKAKKEVEDK